MSVRTLLVRRRGLGSLARGPAAATGLLLCAGMTLAGQRVEAAALPQADVALVAGGREHRRVGEPTVGATFAALGPAETGITFVHRAGRPGTDKRFMIECVGAGLALCDLDGDGDLDAYLVQGGDLAADGSPVGAADALFLNGGDGRFEPGPAGDVSHGFGSGVTAGDVDGDGDEDLFVTNLGANVLLLNQGGAVLAHAPDAGGLAGGADEWSTGACFGDADLDGDLDAYVANYLAHDLSHPMLQDQPCRWMGCEVPCGPQGLVAQADRFFVNEGSGRFRDATEASGVGAATPSYGFQPVFTDLDHDGDLDLFVANDSVAQFAFINQGGDAHGGPRFVEQGLVSGLALSASGRELAGMGVAVGDLDGDLRLDLVVTNFSREPNAAFLNLSTPATGPLFFDEAGTLGLGRPSVPDLGWGANLFDADCDGDLDLFVANGHVYPHVDGCDLSQVSYAQPARLYEQQSPGRFAVQAQPALDAPASRRGSAHGDLDGDGDVDLLVGELDGPVTLLRNDGLPRGGWVSLDLRPVAASVGARVVITAGAWRAAAEVRRGSSFLGTDDRRLHFGVPVKRASLDVTVHWPGGATEHWIDLPRQAVVTLERGQGSP